MIQVGGSVIMCVMAVFFRNRDLIAKALSVARGRKAVVCVARTLWETIRWVSNELFLPVVAWVVSTAPSPVRCVRGGRIMSAM